MSILRALASGASGSFAMGLTPGTYGGGNSIPVITVNSSGNISGVSTATPSIPWSEITGTPTTVSGYGITNAALNTITVSGSNSITGGGDLTANRTLSLVNDSTIPGNSKYYGTDGTGTKGFFSLPTPGTGTVTSITIGTGLSSTQSPLTTAGTLSIDTTAVAALLSGALTAGSIPFAGTAGALTQSNANLYWNTAVSGGTSSTSININTNSDYSGTDSINTYYQVDAYLPNSLISDTANSSQVPGLSVSSSRGTGASPTISLTGDLIGKVGYWAYSGSSPAYNEHASIKAYVTGSTSSNLGGELRLATKADGGVMSTAMTIDNKQTATFVNNVNIPTISQIVFPANIAATTDYATKYAIAMAVSF